MLSKDKSCKYRLDTIEITPIHVFIIADDLQQLYHYFVWAVSFYDYIELSLGKCSLVELTLFAIEYRYDLIVASSIGHINVTL